MKRIIAVLIFVFLAIGYASAQFNPCSVGSPGLCNASSRAPPILTNLRITNTGAFRITNTGANRAVFP